MTPYPTMPTKPLAGILNINKPAGLTSHDVVQRIRRILGIKKVGHTGTLDPLATGVLVVCVGRATRLIEYIVPGEKQYRATLKLGETTNTFDSDGNIVATADPSAITEAAVRQALTRFVGTIQQVPPIYSAIKKDGTPLHRLARQGQSVSPPPRTVHIATIDLLAFEPPFATIYVTCGAGTYIRSLAHDVGQLLAVGAHLTELVRVANGQWHISSAVTLEDLTQAVNAGKLQTVLIPPEAGVTHLPHRRLSAAEKQAVLNGRRIDANQSFSSGTIVGVDDTGHLVAILAPTDDHQLKPKKVFHS